MINYSIAMMGNPAKKQDPKKAFGVAQYTEKMTSFAITILLNTWIIRFFFLYLQRVYSKTKDYEEEQEEVLEYTLGLDYIYQCSRRHDCV